jgi:hypothetical protein
MTIEQRLAEVEKELNIVHRPRPMTDKECAEWFREGMAEHAARRQQAQSRGVGRWAFTDLESCYEMYQAMSRSAQQRQSYRVPAMSCAIRYCWLMLGPGPARYLINKLGR